MRKIDLPAPESSGCIDMGRILGEGTRLVFTDRSGGCSPPPYDTLNLGYRTGDDEGNVARNRDRVALMLNVPSERFVYLRQIHGTGVRQAGLWELERPAGGRRFTFADTDGVYTTEQNLVLAVLTADCLPVALSSRGKAVAMLHAGWRGTFADIEGVALRSIGADLGIKPASFKAVIGPGIGPCCYRVDKGRADAFVEKYGERSGVVTRSHGYHVDLYRANELNLLEAGVREENIYRVEACTCCDKRFYSFRRDGVTGRQGALAFLA